MSLSTTRDQRPDKMKDRVDPTGLDTKKKLALDFEWSAIDLADRRMKSYYLGPRPTNRITGYIEASPPPSPSRSAAEE